MQPRETATIADLRLYIVKSCGGTDLKKAKLTPSGLETLEGIPDRGFMIVKAEPNEEGIHEFITQRDPGLSELAKIKPVLTGDRVSLSWMGADTIYLPPDLSGEDMGVKIWDHIEAAPDQGDIMASWLSDHLNMKVRLIKAAGPHQRGVLNFQDAYPIHWFSLGSLRELSEKAGTRMYTSSFRPNIVVDGFPAQFEHQVSEGEIAGIPFIDPKPCDRCPTTRVNQATGEIIDKKYWPETILATYKRWRNKDGEQKVIFGENMIPRGSGIIKIGDSLTVSSYRNPPLVYGAKV